MNQHMSQQRTTTALARSLLALLLAAPLAAQAQSAADFAAMRGEIRALRAELDALKAAAHPAVAVVEPAPSPPSDAIETVAEPAFHSKEQVVLGDIPDSYRLPNSSASTRLYGFAEMHVTHDIKGDNSDSDFGSFLPYVPLNGTPEAARTGRTFFTARTSRIGILTVMPTPYGRMAIKLEGDFSNDPHSGNAAVNGSAANLSTQQASNGYDFRLRHAYGRLDGFLVGQTWSTFMDVDNAPETVDANGPIGSTFIRQPQIRYSYSSEHMGKFSAALENPLSYVLDGSGAPMPSGFARVPDLIARWDGSYPWGALSVRGVTLEQRVDDGAGGAAARRGYGLAASGLYKVGAGDFLTWGVTGGKGIGRYFNYIEGAAYDANQHAIVLEQALGLVVGYQHKQSDSLRFNQAFGWQRNADNAYTEFAREHGIDSGRFGINRQLWQWHLGLIWNPVPRVDVGLEYILGRRTTLAGQSGDMQRLDLSAKYNFN
ncbi:hypothetical protein AAKU55_005239 [Oxalobacteraceae bacterium GrIS 1.11]